MPLTPGQFVKWHARLYSLPRPFVRPLVAGLFAYMRRTACVHGDHVTMTYGNACWVCGATLQPISAVWPKWSVTLRTGTSVSVFATSAVHAKNLVMFGEESGEEGHTDMLAMKQKRYRVHPDNIVGCERDNGWRGIADQA